MRQRHNQTALLCCLMKRMSKGTHPARKKHYLPRKRQLPDGLKSCCHIRECRTSNSPKIQKSTSKTKLWEQYMVTTTNLTSSGAKDREVTCLQLSKLKLRNTKISMLTQQRLFYSTITAILLLASSSTISMIHSYLKHFTIEAICHHEKFILKKESASLAFDPDSKMLKV